MSLEQLRKITESGAWSATVSAFVSENESILDPDAFDTYWIEAGHHIRDQVANDRLMVVFLRRILEPYSGGLVTLYRGENLSRWRARSLGFSWTSQLETARMLGRGLNAVEEGGVLLRGTFPQSTIIRGPNEHSSYLNEAQFTVDPFSVGAVEARAVSTVRGGQVDRESHSVRLGPRSHMPRQARLTPPEEATLVAALEGALPVAAKARDVDHPLLFQLLALRDTPSSAPQELLGLLSVVQAIPGLELFNHAYQCGLGRQEEVNPRFLVQWLISRAQQVGSKQAVRDVARFLDSETIEVTAILAIDGFGLERDIELGEYELVAWANVAMTDAKWQIVARGLFGGQSPTAAVIQRHEIQRTHVRPWDSPGPNVPPSIEPALDVLRCVTAVADTGFRLLHYWFEPPEWAPWVVSRSTFGVDSTTGPWQTTLNDALAPPLRECVSHLRALDESSRVRLRVPLDRLNRSYLAGMRSVDKAIELGIALESLYAPAKLSEGIAFAVRTRAARFLGGSAEERRGMVALLRDVYDLRSRAAHAGRFDADGASKKWRDDAVVRKALEDGQHLVGRSLVKIIQESEPNWEDFDIGAH